MTDTVDNASSEISLSFEVRTNRRLPTFEDKLAMDEIEEKGQELIKLIKSHICERIVSDDAKDGDCVTVSVNRDAAVAVVMLQTATVMAIKSIAR